MKAVMIIFSIISLATAVVCFIATNNIYFSIAVFLIYLFYFFIIQLKKIRKYQSLSKRVHSCCFFINSCIITLSVKDSFEDSYQSGLRIDDKQLKLYASKLNEYSSYEKIVYLRKFFSLAIYKMFLNILDIYQDQGGNILLMSENLLRECSRTEKKLLQSTNIGIKHLLEFMLLWALSFAVLIFMKFGIGDFYNQMLNNSLIAPLIFVYFLLCIFSIHLFFGGFLNLSIKEDILE